MVTSHFQVRLEMGLLLPLFSSLTRFIQTYRPSLRYINIRLDCDISEAWLHDVRSIFNAVPKLNHFNLLLRNQAHWPEVAGCLAYLSRPLRELSIYFGLAEFQPHQAYRALAKQHLTDLVLARLGRIQSLNFSTIASTVDTDLILQFLVPFTGLRRLTLYVASPDEELYQTLVSRFSRLTHLALHLGPWKIGVLFEPHLPVFRHLISLGLACGRGPHHFRDLGNLLSTDFPHLEHINIDFDVGYSPLTPSKQLALRRFFGQPWPRITALTLTNQYIADHDMIPELGSLIVQFFPQLRELSLYKFADHAPTYALVISKCSNLQTLNIRNLARRPKLS
ncbi:hypothetical protein H4R33_003015 [Dimargaris cristalligena]|nr:hypothetical protein H4R33_003015 [Dimargaris cristalligena]